MRHSTLFPVALVALLLASVAGLAVYAAAVLSMRIGEAHQIRVLLRDQFARLRS